MICENRPLDQLSPADSLYRRQLPDGQIPFSSTLGRLVFQEALAAGTMHAYFPLSEQFHTQAEPTYCGISSLVMVLNALEIDPKRLWKGVWRWFSEDMADCCQQLSIIDKQGITLDGLAELARCNGLHAQAVHANANADSLASFRRYLIRVMSAAANVEAFREAVLVSYSRAILGQTGDGHFSPIGGYHPSRDLVLLLDVARFKYPPHWVPLSELWRAMQAIDAENGMPRGYLELKSVAS